MTGLVFTLIPVVVPVVISGMKALARRFGFAMTPELKLALAPLAGALLAVGFGADATSVSALVSDAVMQQAGQGAGAGLTGTWVHQAVTKTPLGSALIDAAKVRRDRHD